MPTIDHPLRTIRFTMAMIALLVSPHVTAQDQDAVFSTTQLEQAAALRDNALANSRAYDIVASLTMEVGPRFAGSEGDRAGVAWALEMMRELGLQNIRPENVIVPHWVRGSVSVNIVSPYPHQLVATALGGSIGSPVEGIEAPVIRVQSLDELDGLNASDVAGKIVFFDRRMEARPDGSDYGPTVAARREGPAKAAAKGAVAVAIRSAGTSDDRLAHTGTTKYAEGVRQIPAVALSNPDADMLARQIGTGQLVDLNIKLSARRLPDQRSANVVGEIRGSERPEEIVLLAAHLDSWDLGDGAIDDGAGVAIISEAARLIKASGLRPARTIRVVLYANEEFGLSGAHAYAERYANTLRQHVVGMEADFGGGRVREFSTLLPADRVDLADAIYTVLEPLGVARGDNESGSGADLSPLRKLGLPVLSLQQDGTAYFDYHHTANDTLDKLDPADMRQATAAFVAATWLAASADADFGFREPEAEEN